MYYKRLICYFSSEFCLNGATSGRQKTFQQMTPQENYVSPSDVSRKYFTQLLERLGLLASCKTSVLVKHHLTTMLGEMSPSPMKGWNFLWWNDKASFKQS